MRLPETTRHLCRTQSVEHCMAHTSVPHNHLHLHCATGALQWTCMEPAFFSRDGPNVAYIFGDSKVGRGTRTRDCECETSPSSSSSLNALHLTVQPAVGCCSSSLQLVLSSDCSCCYCVLPHAASHLSHSLLPCRHVDPPQPGRVWRGSVLL